MKKRLIALGLCAVLLFCSGCASILEGETLSVSPHVEDRTERVPAKSYMEIESYDALYDAVRSMVANHAEKGYFRASNYSGDLDADVEKACQSVYYDDPLGAFALYYITGATSRIVTYYEVEITATYKRTWIQMNSIISASSLRYFESELLNRLTGYSDYFAVRIDLESVTPESIVRFLSDAYYDNPIRVVVAPEVTVNMFPDEGEDRIAEVICEYDYPTRELRSMTEELRRAALELSGRVESELDHEILLELCLMLSEATEFDLATANDGSFTRRDKVATAYGALVEHLAVGEGFAMAYKALCDEFGIDCRVVIGRKNGVAHAWNIVKLDGDWFHVDVSACEDEGLQAAFLLNDADMTGYWWDSLEYVACDSGRGFEDFFPPEEPEEQPEEAGEPEPEETPTEPEDT